MCVLEASFNVSTSHCCCYKLKLHSKGPLGAGLKTQARTRGPPEGIEVRDFNEMFDVFENLHFG